MTTPALAFLLLTSSWPSAKLGSKPALHHLTSPLSRPPSFPARSGLVLRGAPALARDASAGIQGSAPSHRSAMAEKAITKEHVDALMANGFVIIDNAITADMAKSVVDGAGQMRKNGKLSIVAEQWDQGRRDEMMVMDTWDPSWGPIPPEFQGVADACSFLKGVAEAVARHVTPPHEWSRLCAPAYMQLAVYANKGNMYVRHLDNDVEDERGREGPPGLRVCDRVVTALLYFNADWEDKDGGYLRVYSPDEGKQEEVAGEYAPIAGRLVLFDSKRVFHEVLPSFKTRWALSAWMTDGDAV